MTEADQASEAGRWFRYAREDLRTAERLAADGETPPRYVCYLSQQAAEKALKAILVLLQIDFPKTHDLDRLRGLVPVGWMVVSEHSDLAELSEWVAEARYPGDWTEPAETDARASLTQARAVVDCVWRDFRDRGVLEDIAGVDEAAESAPQPSQGEQP